MEWNDLINLLKNMLTYLNSFGDYSLKLDLIKQQSKTKGSLI